MNNIKNSSINMLKVLACVIFDIALILAFFKSFGLFFIIAPDKSILMLFVLLVGIIISNGAMIFPNILFRCIGMPYSVAITILFLFYALVANIFSIFLIAGSIVWYIVWELIVFAAFIVLLFIIATFSKGVTENITKDEREQTDKTLIKLQLHKIEDALNTKENQEALGSSVVLFKALKERIYASTPFGRITGNSVILDLEDQIKSKLMYLEEILNIDISDETVVELEKLLKETRKLVINRETLNIK